MKTDLSRFWTNPFNLGELLSIINNCKILLLVRCTKRRRNESLKKL